MRSLQSAPLFVAAMALLVLPVLPASAQRTKPPTDEEIYAMLPKGLRDKTGKDWQSAGSEARKAMAHEGAVWFFPEAIMKDASVSERFSKGMLDCFDHLSNVPGGATLGLVGMTTTCGKGLVEIEAQRLQ